MLIVALIILFFNNNIYNLNIKIISYILNKYIPDNYHNKINTFLNKGTEYNKKIYKYIDSFNNKDIINIKIRKFIY